MACQPPDCFKEACRCPRGLSRKMKTGLKTSNSNFQETRAISDWAKTLVQEQFESARETRNRMRSGLLGQVRPVGRLTYCQWQFFHLKDAHAAVARFITWFSRQDLHLKMRKALCASCVRIPHDTCATRRTLIVSPAVANFARLQASAPLSPRYKSRPRSESADALLPTLCAVHRTWHSKACAKDRNHRCRTCVRALNACGICDQPVTLVR